MAGSFWNDQALRGAFSSGYKDRRVENLEWIALERAVKTYLRLMPDSSSTLSCLEIGCHVGYTTRRLFALMTPRIFDAVDASAAAIAAANKFKVDYGFEGVSFKCASASALPGDAEAYDVCFSIRCIQNMADINEQCSALNEVYRLLKAGGYLFLAENWQGALDRLNALREATGLERLNPPDHCVFLDDLRLRPFVESLFVTVSEEHFASGYYFGTRFAKWLDPRAAVEDLNDRYNQFFSGVEQTQYKLRLGPSLMVLRRREREN